MSGGGGGLGTIAGLGLSALAPELAPEILGAGADAGETMLFNTVVGGAGSALLGGNPLLGAALGGIGGTKGIAQLLQGQMPTQISAAFPALMGQSATQVPAGDFTSMDPAYQSFAQMYPPQQQGLPGQTTPLATSDTGAAPGLTYSSGSSGSPAAAAAAPVTPAGVSAPVASSSPYPSQGGLNTDQGIGTPPAVPDGWNGSYDDFMSMFSNMGHPAAAASQSGILNWIKNNPMYAAGLGLGGYTLYNLLSGKGNSYLPKFTPQGSTFRSLSPSFAPVRPMAEGGITSLPTAQRLIRPNVNFMGNDSGYPMGQQTAPAYAMSSQMPTSAQQVLASYEPATNPLTGEPTVKSMAIGGPTNYDPYAQLEEQAMVSRLSGMPQIIPTASKKGGKIKGHDAGGQLGSYSDGGQMLDGPGDGMSDSIPASISGKQPARLADGEFVVPADVVSHLGNGSTDAGAKQLYSMMDRVRTARTGRKQQGKQINANKFMPA